MHSNIYIDEKHSEISCKTKVKLINQPEGFDIKFIMETKSFELINILNTPVDFIYLFVKSKDELFVELPVLAKFLKTKGTIIISFPNTDSSSISDLSFEEINKLASKVSLKFVKDIFLVNLWDSFIFLSDKD